MAPTWPSIIPEGAITSAPALGLRDGDRRVALQRGVVVDLAGVGEQAAVAVVGVLVEAVVGHQDERVAHLVAQVAQRDLHHAVGGVGAASRGRPWWSGTPKRITAGTPRSASARTSLRRLSWVCCTTPGIDDDRLRRVEPLLHEQRRDQVVDREPGFGHQPPHRGRAAEPAHASRRERHAARLPLDVLALLRVTRAVRRKRTGGWRRGRRWCAGRPRRRRAGRVRPRWPR